MPWVRIMHRCVPSISIRLPILAALALLWRFCTDWVPCTPAAVLSSLCSCLFNTLLAALHSGLPQHAVNTWQQLLQRCHLGKITVAATMQWLVMHSAVEYYVDVHTCDPQCWTQGLCFGALYAEGLMPAACVFPRIVLIVMQGNH